MENIKVVKTIDGEEIKVKQYSNNRPSRYKGNEVKTRIDMKSFNRRCDEGVTIYKLAQEFGISRNYAQKWKAERYQEVKRMLLEMGEDSEEDKINNPFKGMSLGEISKFNGTLEVNSKDYKDLFEL